MTASLDAAPRLDHLVVLADTLGQGVAWCEATLGVTPGPGGEHPLFGTHNRLLSVAAAAFPLAYLEIIAINKEAASAGAAGATGRKRWFDMDDEALHRDVRQHGPRLIHWVARVPDADSACAALAVQGLDGGDVLRASRETPHGLLEWKIAVRPDGRRLMDGCLPTLIEWGAVHPAAAMPASGLSLSSFSLQHPQPDALRAALAAIGLPNVAVLKGDHPALRAVLQSPRGPVTLTS